MDEVVRLKSRFVSSRPGEDSSTAPTGPDASAARLVEGILRRKSFYFQQRTGKLDMRAIGRVDIASVVKDVDVDTLQAHLENITFASVSEDDLRLYSDQCFLNLFRLSQLLLEYLLSVQDTLATSLEDRALKREIRQKRATIARYEQLLALPAPPSGRDVPGGNGGGLHSCLTCGKMFTTAEFLQQHIARKHARHAGSSADTKVDQEEKTAYPTQLRLFVQTLRECSIPPESQLVLIDTESTVEAENKRTAGEEDNGKAAAVAAQESAAAKQMATLVDLMRQQMEWNMRSESGRREKDLGSAEALETRMRGIEASLPRRLEEFMEESVGDLKASVRQALDGMEELHAKRSNAGAIQDDEDETRRKEQQEKLRLASLSADMERVSKENSALLQELAKLKAPQAAASPTSASTVQTPAAVVVVKEESSRPEVDGLVEFYEQNVPIQAKESSVVGQSMAEIDLAAKRHVKVGQKGKGGDGALLGQWGDHGEDGNDHAEKQVESIRAQLSATLTSERFPANNTDLSKSVSISRTAPGLGLTASSTPKGGTDGLEEDDIFGDTEGEDHLSLAELERTVEERKRLRPPGMERQMESVSKSMEKQLNQLLEKAEEELQQLEEDSLGYGPLETKKNSIKIHRDAPMRPVHSRDLHLMVVTAMIVCESLDTCWFFRRVEPVHSRDLRLMVVTAMIVCESLNAFWFFMRGYEV
ncbi:C2H2 zinc finger protein [Ectocarpus siliculosus]|uniref:C2H2 zinc finger protein n=1 Tax=Ectocarpus siliculosus TaxID=2880 RepID=D8LJD7_ECTSI|nr:C2H2 zinc finger protein [Ectocarpus siliculosus]|eukprot:CBN79470.1 C2H2 zinc finger protein [Ectocarpus siliculosus]